MNWLFVDVGSADHLSLLWNVIVVVVVTTETLVMEHVLWPKFIKPLFSYWNHGKLADLYILV